MATNEEQTVTGSRASEPSSNEIVVGVTGHRILAEPDRIRDAVSTALNQIVYCFPGRPITLLSSLAEGADRIVAEQTLSLSDAKLVVPLPMPKSSYLEDFARPESKQEFLNLLNRATEVIELTQKPARSDSYKAAGQYILDHSDILLAVWDGQTEQGEGGTGSIVAEGRKRALPFIWVHAGNRKPGTHEPTTLGTEQGVVTQEHFPPVIHILEAVRRHDPIAMKLQKRRWTFARVAASIGPLAVLLLVTQTLAIGNATVGIPYSVGVFLILTELLLLAVALWISFLGMGRSHKDWIRERLRTEILRREEFLLLARVGPYLGVPLSSLVNRVRERLLLIESEVRDPLQMLSMADGQISWRDALEDAKTAGTLSALPDFTIGIQSYIERRVASQREWFSSRSLSHDKSSRFYENGAKLTLTLALIFAGIHLGHLWAQHGAAAALESVPKGNPNSESPLVALTILAICLPALGSAFVGLQSILGSERLARSYRYQASELLTMEEFLRRLQDRLQAPNAPPPLESQFQFMRAVLAAEALFSSELGQWWLVMYPTSPRA
jgi:hypothetical protein